MPGREAQMLAPAHWICSQVEIQLYASKKSIFRFFAYVDRKNDSLIFICRLTLAF